VKRLTPLLRPALDMGRLVTRPTMSAACQGPPLEYRLAGQSKD
jgi:hypothetical protein